MKASNPYWKAQLDIPKDLATEIDGFEVDLNLRKQGKLEEKLFAETRLRRGAYGQRYDNGQRFDGHQNRGLEYPDADKRQTKGPNTLWDAPGMLRIKVPYGGLNQEQCFVLAELAEEYSDAIAHVTTRQDIQLHFIHLEDTPAIMQRLASVGITTREACGNSVRNVTACPKSGCCKDEVFDVTPYARALTYFFLGHHDVQDFGRKFKISFSACQQHACALSNIHDLGLLAKTRTIAGKLQRGFAFHVGGGLGAVPHASKLLADFVPVEELLPYAQAIARVFSRLGEKKNRARARVKFLVAKLGIDTFRDLVDDERRKQPYDERWTSYLDSKGIAQYDEEGPLLTLDEPVLTIQAPLTEPLATQFPDASSDAAKREALKQYAPYKEWLEQNVLEQKQEGYRMVCIKLPLGDISSFQLRTLAEISQRYIHETIRSSVEQNMLLRWVREADLAALYCDLVQIELAEPGASKITDIVACPGTDTCKLGISASRGLAAQLRDAYQRGDLASDTSIEGLHIKISGCFNSCSQHHISDLGFYGVSRKVQGHAVPHFLVVLGGQWEANAASYGLPIVAIPSKNIPEVIKRLTQRYKQERLAQNEGALSKVPQQETFRDFIQRLGKVEIKRSLEDLAKVPSYEEDSSYYSDWGDPREYSISDMGIGECAGEVVSRIDLDLAAAERKVFEAQILLDDENLQKSGETAYQAMLDGARALVKTAYLDIEETPEHIIREFKERFCDTKIFFDPYAGSKFASYLFRAHEKAPQSFSEIEQVRHQIEEASLFIEACHRCSLRIVEGVKV